MTVQLMRVAWTPGADPVDQHLGRRGGGGVGATRPRAAHGHPELTLQLLNLPAERRLGDVESLRGAGEVTLFRDGDERASESELQHRRVPRRSRTARLGVQ